MIYVFQRETGVLPALTASPNILRFGFTPQGNGATPTVVAQFTVSGPDVRDLFGPVDGVSYTWSPTQRRTA